MADLPDAVTPWWQAVDEAVESLVADLTTGAARAASRSGRKRPQGRPRPKRRTKSIRRSLAEVIRSHRLARGVTVDRNTIAALFTGHRELVTDPALIVAVAQACAILAGRKLTAKEAARLRSASARIAELIARAEAADLSTAATPAAAGAEAATPRTAEAAAATPRTAEAAGAAGAAAASIPAGPAPRRVPSPQPSAAPAGRCQARGSRGSLRAATRRRRDGVRYRRRLIAVAVLLMGVIAVLVAIRTLYG